MLSFFLSCKTSFCYACSRLYHTRLTRAPHETRNILVFYEIKKPNKIKGLVMVVPKGCYSFLLCLRNVMAVSFVSCYLHAGISPIMPREPEALRLLHTQQAQTGTHNTEPPQTAIQALKSPCIYNTHTQHRKHPQTAFTAFYEGMYTHVSSFLSVCNTQRTHKK